MNFFFFFFFFFAFQFLECTVIEIQHMKFQESAVSKAILSTVYKCRDSKLNEIVLHVQEIVNKYELSVYKGTWP